MTGKDGITINPGAVEALIIDAPNRTYLARWFIPLFSGERLSALQCSFAADAFLTGRWTAGIPTESDRNNAQATEEDWRSECSCERKQPCRHAVTASFRFREQAKSNPWLWLEVRGLSREEFLADVHRERLKLNSNDAERNAKDEWTAATEQITAGGAISPILHHAEDPPFWNRDISFADWLGRIYTNVKRGDASL